MSFEIPYSEKNIPPAPSIENASEEPTTETGYQIWLLVRALKKHGFKGLIADHLNNIVGPDNWKRCGYPTTRFYIVTLRDDAALAMAKIAFPDEAFARTGPDRTIGHPTVFSPRRRSALNRSGLPKTRIQVRFYGYDGEEWRSDSEDIYSSLNHVGGMARQLLRGWLRILLWPDGTRTVLSTDPDAFQKIEREAEFFREVTLVVKKSRSR